MGVRVRLTAWYAGLVAVTVAALAWFVVGRLQAEEARAIDGTLAVAAERIARGTPPASALPSRTAGAQVLDAGGRVRAWAGDPVAARPLGSRAGTVRLRDEDYRVRAVALAGGGRAVVAQSLDAAEDA